MSFPSTVRSLSALVCISICTLTQGVQAEYLDQMPDTEMCETMKNDVDPNIESEQNKTDIEFLFNGTVRQGRNGDQCNQFRSRRSQLRSDSSLNATGAAKYYRERVFAVGRLCLLDWCDMTPGPAHADEPPVVQPDAPTDQVQPSPSPKTTPAPPPVVDNGNYALEICNSSGIPILSIAFAFYDPSIEDWSINGWWTIENGKCITLHRPLGKYRRHDIYYHAEGEDYMHWNKNGADTNLCVENKRFTRTPEQSCPAPHRIVGFKKLQVTKDGPNLIRLTK